MCYTSPTTGVSSAPAQLPFNRNATFIAWLSLDLVVQFEVHEDIGLIFDSPGLVVQACRLWPEYYLAMWLMPIDVVVQ
jgi:hypothetical protein